MGKIGAHNGETTAGKHMWPGFLKVF